MTDPIQPTWHALRCTRCGGELFIEMIDKGSAWQSYREVDYIYCACGAEWNRRFQRRAVTILRDVEPITNSSFDTDRFERAPCYVCGYNGAGYFNPQTHPCAQRYHDEKIRL